MADNIDETIVAMKEKIQKQAKAVDQMIDRCYVEQLTKLNEHHQKLKKELQDELSWQDKALTTQLELAHKNMKNQHEGPVNTLPVELTVLNLCLSTILIYC